MGTTKNSIARFIRERIWTDLPVEVTARMRRIAAASWSGVLALLAGFIYWNRRRHGVDPGLLPAVLAGAAPLLALALLVSAGFGARTYLVVLRGFALFGFVITQVALTLAFYLIVTPMGLALRWMGKDPLRTREGAGPAWLPYTGSRDRSSYYRLFQPRRRTK